MCCVRSTWLRHVISTKTVSVGEYTEIILLKWWDGSWKAFWTCTCVWKPQNSAAEKGHKLLDLVETAVASCFDMCWTPSKDDQPQNKCTQTNSNLLNSLECKRFGSTIRPDPRREQPQIPFAKQYKCLDSGYEICLPNPHIGKISIPCITIEATLADQFSGSCRPEKYHCQLLGKPS